MRVSLLLLLCWPALAADRYVLDGGTSSTCLSWSDACDQATTAENLIARGETIWIGGKSDGTDGVYSNVVWNVANSGTTLITVNKATVANHGTSTGWNNAYATGQAQFVNWEVHSNYWLFDGQTGGGPGSSTTWTTGFGFHFTQTSGNSIEINPGSAASNHITIKHFEIIGNLTQGAVAVKAVPVSGTVDSLTASYFYMNGIGNCPFLLVPVSNFVVEYGYFGTYTGDGSHHSELMSLWGGSTSGTFRYNIVTHIDSTGGIMYDNAGNPSDSVDIYGNVFYRASGDNSWNGNNGVLGGWTGGNGEDLHNMHVYNNACISVDLDFYGTLPVRQSGNIAKNNLHYNCSSVDFSVFTTHDYNHFINSGGTHSEANGTTAASGDPFVAFASLNFHLTANTAAGVTLSSPYTTDPDGVTRGSSGAWTRGAYEYVSTATAPPKRYAGPRARGGPVTSK